MIQYQLKQNQNEKLPAVYSKWYAYPVIRQTLDLLALAEHMASHNTPFSVGTIYGLLTDMVKCIKEQCQEGNAVKIDNLAIFSLGIVNKQGADSEKDFSVIKNIAGVRLRARATGLLTSAKLTRSVNLKKIGTTADPEDTTPVTPPDGSGDGTEPGGGGGGDEGVE